MIPERIKNAVSSYNFSVENYRHIISQLDLSDGLNMQAKWKLLEELHRREIDLLGVIDGYNILAEELKVELVELVPVDTYETEQLFIYPLLFAAPVKIPFTVQTYKLGE